LAKSFPGRDELLQQLASLTVREIDEEGSLELKVDSSIVAAVQERIATEARYLDSICDNDNLPFVHLDNLPFVHLLLHVVNGRMVELERYKDDGSPILRPPQPDELIVGWD
jgi:hypothetical protein